ncbi:MAG: hypothetical protein HY902_19565 [Deltaproteobacteria bacterium]|nr:hypothetical protein [Deltaproteobacteria bacterium]
MTKAKCSELGRHRWPALALGLWLWGASASAWADTPAEEAPAATPAPAPSADSRKEVNCSDRKDDDGDGLVDCADHDCAASPDCKVGSGPENSNARCSDWFDNDGDGFIDCDDPDCEGSGITVCKGSWREPAGGGGNASGAASMADDVPELGPGQTVEDLIGKGGDKDGERNDEVCSDGLDNDGDGRIDCADFGCRFDPDVTVCRGNPGIRFGVVGRLEGGMTSTDRGEGATLVTKDTYDTRFSTLSIRAFGPTPLVQNSFFLVSAHLDGTPRVTFALFQMPIGHSQHFFSVNSGGASLSTALIVSPSKQLLLEPAYYLTNAFEQPTGGSAEVWGPLLPRGLLTYRVFGSAGSGSYGVVGALSSTTGNAVEKNFPFNVGGQLVGNIIGTLNRWDSPFLYVPVPTALGVTLGGKYEQRTNERYPVGHVGLVGRHKRLHFKAEAAYKYEIDYSASSVMYNVQAGFLVIPKYLLVAADFGAFVADDYQMGSTARTDVNRQRDEQQFRVAIHGYIWKNVGIASLLYRDDQLQGTVRDPKQHIRELTANLQFRF